MQGVGEGGVRAEQEHFWAGGWEGWWTGQEGGGTSLGDLHQILTLLASPASHQAARICTSNVPGADPSSPIRVAAM